MKEVKVVETVARMIVAPRWAGAESIPLVHQSNEQCIAFLCELALSPSRQGLPPFVLQHREHWCRLDAQAHKRLAALPFVMVDLRFQDAAWWSGAAVGFAPDSPYLAPSVDTSLQFSKDFVMETILFARQTAREQRHVAQMMFGMTAEVAKRVAALTLQQVRAIAEQHSRWMRVRWAEDLGFWQDGLIAARSADEEALAELRHYAKLLLTGELVAHAPNTAS